MELAVEPTHAAAGEAARRRRRRYRRRRRRRRRARTLATPLLAELRAFYAPYNAALAALLRKRGQAHTARYVESWRENASTAQLPATTAERE